MSRKSLSDKEAALLAAARRELSRHSAAAPQAGETAQIRPAAQAVNQAPRVSTPAPAQPASAATPEYESVAEPPAAPDIATRMAMLMDAERQESKSRKQRVKKIYVIIVTTIMVPSFLYVFITMFKLLAR